MKIKTQQTTSSQIWLSSSKMVEIQVTVDFDLGAETDSDVSIELSYEPKIPASWQEQDALHQKLYDGVHAGLADAKMPVLATCLNFNVTQVSVSPALEDFAAEDKNRIGDLLQELVRSMVVALCRVHLRRSN